ncbi:MAG: biopolymer transporter ExbD [Chitinivibrionia bacterium]|nr:biopolymer transporter ExbD [Chitinivibrionia bacterium]
MKTLGDISNLPSMSDIAFLLLIFFLVSTMFAVEQGIPLVLPGRQSTNVTVKRSDVLEIDARANGAITLDGRPVSLRDIRPAVEKGLAQNEKLIVVLSTHPNTEYGLMVDLLDEIKLANARVISLRTLPAEG